MTGLKMRLKKFMEEKRIKKQHMLMAGVGTLLAAVLIAGIVQMNARADTVSFGGVDFETEDGYYLISTPEQLNVIRTQVVAGGYKFKLTQDLTISLAENGGLANSSFLGELDGNGYEISINTEGVSKELDLQTDNQGLLFGTFEGKVHDLILSVDGTVTLTSKVTMPEFGQDYTTEKSDENSVPKTYYYVSGRTTTEHTYEIPTVTNSYTASVVEVVSENKIPVTKGNEVKEILGAVSLTDYDSPQTADITVKSGKASWSRKSEGTKQNEADGTPTPVSLSKHWYDASQKGSDGTTDPAADGAASVSESGETTNTVSTTIEADSKTKTYEISITKKASTSVQKYKSVTTATTEQQYEQVKKTFNETRTRTREITTKPDSVNLGALAGITSFGAKISRYSQTGTMTVNVEAYEIPATKQTCTLACTVIEYYKVDGESKVKQSVDTINTLCGAEVEQATEGSYSGSDTFTDAAHDSGNPDDPSAGIPAVYVGGIAGKNRAVVALGEANQSMGITVNLKNSNGHAAQAIMENAVCSVGGLIGYGEKDTNISASVVNPITMNVVADGASQQTNVHKGTFSGERTPSATVTLTNCALGVSGNLTFTGTSENIQYNNCYAFGDITGIDGESYTAYSTLTEEQQETALSACKIRNLHLSTGGANPDIIAQDWLCTTLDTTKTENPDIEFTTSQDKDKFTITVHTTKRPALTKAYLNYEFFDGGEVGVRTQEKVMEDGSLSDLDLGIGISAYVKINNVTAFDGHQYYVSSAPVTINRIDNPDKYNFLAEEKAIRESDTPDVDYIEPYIVSANSTGTYEALESPKFYYRTVGSNGAFTEAASYKTVSAATFAEDGKLAVAQIPFTTETATYEGYWSIGGYAYALCKVGPTEEGKTYTIDDRTAVEAPRMKGTGPLKYVAFDSAELARTTFDLIPYDAADVKNNLCSESQDIQVSEYDFVAGADKEQYTYSYKVAETPESLTYEQFKEGSFTALTSENLDLASFEKGKKLYLAVAREKENHKAAILVYQITLIGEDWDDDVTAAPDNGTVLWSDEEITISTSLNKNQFRESYGIGIEGFAYIICKQELPTEQCSLLAYQLKEQPDINSNIVESGLLTADIDGNFDGRKILMNTAEKYMNSNQNFYVYYQMTGETVGKVRKMNYTSPSNSAQPSIVPYTGSSINTAESFTTGDKAYLSGAELLVYKVTTGATGAAGDALTYQTVSSTQQKESLEASTPSIGKSIPVYEKRGTVLYVGCDGKWYSVNGGAVYQDEIVLTNATNTPQIQCISALGFNNGYFPSREAENFYYSVQMRGAAQPVTFDPAADSIERYSYLFLADETPNTEIYYMVDQKGGTFTQAQKDALGTVTYGMAESALPAGVKKYDTKGIYVNGSTNCNVAAVAVSAQARVSAVSEKSYTITNPTTCAEITSVPVCTASSSPTVNPGDKILLKCATAGSDIYYSTNGKVELTQQADGSYIVTPGAESTTLLYNSSEGILMPPQENASVKTFTVTAVAVKKGLSQGTPTSLLFTYPAAVLTPYSTLTQGQVAIGTQVKLLCDTQGAIIYYTLGYNGEEPQDPTTSSAIYDGAQPITVNRDVTIKAMAVKNAVQSEVITLKYTAADRLAAPTASLGSGSVTVRGTIITLSAADGATVYYTTDGSSPLTSGNTAVVTGNTVIIEGQVGALVTIKACAKAEGKTDSEEATFTYTISQYTGGITSDTPSGTELSAGATINLISDVSDAVLYYTIDGSTPTTASKSGTSVKLNGTAGTTITVKAVAIAAGGETKAYALFSYKLKGKPSTVNASPAGGELTRATAVSLTAASGSIYYTTDGTDPTAASNLYSEAIQITRETTLKAIAITDDGEASDVSTFTYTTAGKVSAPVSDIASGTVAPGTTVHLTTETEDAVIYYSTDGTKPTSQNLDQLLVYTSDGISVNRNVSIRAVAYMEDRQLSGVLELEYIVDKIPAVEEKERLAAQLEENALHDTDASRLGDKRQPYDISGTRFKGVVLTEYDYHTVVSSETAVLPSTAKLSTKRMNSNTTINNNIKAVFGEKYGVIAAYNIEVSANDMPLQPEGTIEIGIPIPENMESAVLYIAYIDDNAAVTKLETRRDGNMAYATSSHLSCYALVGMDQADQGGFSIKWIYVVGAIAVYSFLFVIGYGIATIHGVHKRRAARRKKKSEISVQDYPNE